MVGLWSDLYKKQNPEVCIAGTTGYYDVKIGHFIYVNKLF